MGSNMEIGVRFVTDTQGIEQGINSIVNNASMPQMAGANGSVSNIPNAQGQNNTNELAGFTADLLNSLNDTLKKVTESFKALSEQSQNQVRDNLVNRTAYGDASNNRTQSDPNDTTNQANKNVLSGTRNFLTGYNTVNGMAGNAINGNIGGAVSTGMSGAGQMAMSGAGTAATMGAGTATVGALAGVGAALLAVGGAVKLGSMLSDKYEGQLGTFDSLLTNFGSTKLNRNSGRMNAAIGLDMYNQLFDKEYIQGTGLKANEFVNLMSPLSGYGITDFDRAARLTNRAANWSRYTGIDSQKAIQFMGTVERYGGNGEETINNAYNAAKKSGLEKNQFSEFLEGVQRAMENGISKGFVRSADDVSKALASFATMSGNPMWQGKAGADRYEQMTNALSNNTNLNTVGSMLLYQTQKQKNGADRNNNNDGMIDILADIEKNDLSPEFMKSLHTNAKNIYGNDRDSVIANYKETFGLNWNGARDLYNMLENPQGGSVTTNQIKSITENPELKSDQTRLIDATEKLNSAMVNLGNKVFNLKLDALDSIGDNVEVIALNSKNELYKRAINGELKELFHYNAEDSGIDNTAFNNTKKMLGSYSIPEIYDFLSNWATASKAEKTYILNNGLAREYGNDINNVDKIFTGNKDYSYLWTLEEFKDGSKVTDSLYKAYLNQQTIDNPYSYGGMDETEGKLLYDIGEAIRLSPTKSSELQSVLDLTKSITVSADSQQGLQLTENATNRAETIEKIYQILNSLNINGLQLVGSTS